MNFDSPEDLMALMTSEEPLHPDLLPYLEDDGPLGGMLRHPLVYDMMPRPGMVNRMYDQKVKAVAEAKASKDWSQVIWLHERPHRFDALEKMYDDVEDDEQWWSLVADVWNDSENIWQNADEWSELLDSERPSRHAMMNEEEREALAALPEIITMYRGAQSELNEDGMSFTTDLDRARWFATRFAREGNDPVILTLTVPREKVIAYLARRNESEIIAFAVDVTVVSVEFPEQD